MENRGDEFFGTGDVARMLDLKRWQLISYIESGRVSDSSLRLRGRRIFLGADVERIRAELDGLEQKNQGRSHDRKK